MTKKILLLIAFLVCGAIAVSGGAPGHRAHLSDDLLRHESRRTDSRARVIVHGTRSQLEALADRHHLEVVRWLDKGAVMRASSDQVSELAADHGVDHLSGDPLVAPAMTISDQSTFADRAWAGAPGLLGIGAIPGVNGAGVAVAVVDSGIAPHVTKKVIANVSFVTGDSSPVDTFGHGTHVAGIIAGSGAWASLVTSAYKGGIAPRASLVNVRVLGADGTGYTSDVIAGIDWVIANRARFNIRVLNLSIGHPVVEPAATDPLCEAVDRAVAAGLVVVTSAGNAGRAPNGAPELGGITSPGNSPLALTVGALNTWGTVARSDDSVADYSSRGPTKYDLAVKPDVAAPGTRIVSLDADGTFLSSRYPFLHVAGGGSNGYMQLSGTSMAAPMVSGAAALLIQGAPSLTPAQVKLALQSGATYMSDGGLMGAGAGSVDIWASRKVTANGLSALTGAVVETVLPSSSGASFWDSGRLSSRIYDGTGIRPLGSLELLPDWLTPSLLRFGDLNLVGLLNPLRLVPPNPLIWGEVANWRTSSNNDAIVWGTALRSSSGDAIVWGTSADDDAIVWGTGTLTAPEPH